MEGDKKHSHQFQVGEARARLTRNSDCFKDGTYYSKKIEVDGFKYLFIYLEYRFESPDRRNNKKAEGDASNLIDVYKLLWLDHLLNREDYDHAILFTHIPLFTPDIKTLQSSRNTYFLDLKDTIPQLHTLTIPEDGKMKLNDVLNRYTRVKAVISGHKHASAHYGVKFTAGHAIRTLLTGPCGTAEMKWRRLSF